MPSTKKSSVNIGLPASPETTNKELFQELIRVYNAITILAQTLDDYTENGALMQEVNAATTAIEGLTNTITDLKHTGIFDTLKSNGAFSCNGKSVQTSAVVPAAATDLATTLALVNALRTATIANGICV